MKLLYFSFLLSLTHCQKQFNSIFASQPFEEDCYGAYEIGLKVGGQSLNGKISTYFNLNVFSPCSYSLVNATERSFSVEATIYNSFLQQCRIDKSQVYYDYLTFAKDGQPTAPIKSDLITYNRTRTACCPPSTIYISTSNSGLMSAIGNDLVDTIAFTRAQDCHLYKRPRKMTIGQINPEFMKQMTVFAHRPIPVDPFANYYYTFENYSLSLGHRVIPFDQSPPSSYAMANTGSPFITMRVGEFDTLVRRLQVEYGVPLTVFEEGALRLAAIPPESSSCLSPITMSIGSFQYTFDDYVLDMPQLDSGCASCNACLLQSRESFCDATPKLRVLAFAGYSRVRFTSGPPRANPQYQVGTFFWRHFDTCFMKHANSTAFVAISST